MGYTHYWTNGDWAAKPYLRDNAYKNAAKVFQAVEENVVFGRFVDRKYMAEPNAYSGVIIHEGMMITSMNGYTSDSRPIDFGHEPVYLHFGKNNASTSCCKTNRKPYDIAVVALLALLEMSDIITDVHSDGGSWVFAKHWENVIRYSVEENLKAWKTDEDCIKLLGYKIPTVQEAQDAFRTVYARLKDQGVELLPIDPHQQSEAQDKKADQYPSYDWF